MSSFLAKKMGGGGPKVMYHYTATHGKGEENEVPTGKSARNQSRAETISLISFPTNIGDLTLRYY